jgi:NAD(P)-dependent dehydrogenase (short-subunit alcohol dehydrogenase family)
MRGLAGKVAIVAGGGSGIGAATAARLAEEGAHVVVGDIVGENAEKVVAGLGGDARAMAVPFDIADERSVDELFAATTSAFGRVDVVHVNAADLSPSIVGRDSDAVEVDLGVFDRTMEVNLRGHLLVTRRAIPELLAVGGGALVYTSSAAAFVGEPQRPSYAMSKAGINALVRHVAGKWGRDGIRANAIAPGLVITEKLAATLDPDTFQASVGLLRAPRHGRPADIAAAVAFLASDDGEWINGQVLSVDGGSTLR